MRITKKAESKAPVTELEEAIESFSTAKQMAAEYGNIASLAQERIIKLMERDGVKDGVFTVAGKRLKVSVVTAETVKFNEAHLLKILGKRAFVKICDLKLNKTLLKDAIGRGEIDPQMIAEASSIVSNAPYVRISLDAGEATSE